MSTLIETDSACPPSRAAKPVGKQAQINADIDVNRVRRRKLVHVKDAAKFWYSRQKFCLISSICGENSREVTIKRSSIVRSVQKVDIIVCAWYLIISNSNVYSKRRLEIVETAERYSLWLLGCCAKKPGTSARRLTLRAVSQLKKFQRFSLDYANLC